AFMRPLIPFAAYHSPGPYSRDRTGWFYVTVPDPALPLAKQERILRDHCRWELAATALHEGHPGHHLQFVHAQAQASDVRKNIWTPLTVEGWALYCEDMMGEEGFYRTEEEQLFQRLHLLWRAVRILLDVGLHTRGMSFDESVERLTALGMDRTNAEAEVRRYCAEPAYAMCYAVGRRELLKLREEYRVARGGDFTLRQFHEAVLRGGGLRRRVREARRGAAGRPAGAPGPPRRARVCGRRAGAAGDRVRRGRVAGHRTAGRGSPRQGAPHPTARRPDSRRDTRTPSW